MKKIIELVFMFAFVFAAVNTALADEPRENWRNIPDPQLYKVEADLRIQEFEKNIKSLEATLQGLDAKIAELKKEIEKVKADYTSCRQALLDLLDATEQDIVDFRQKLGVIVGSARSMKGQSDEQLYEQMDKINQLEENLNKLRVIKIAVMSEFYDKIISTAREIRSLRTRAENAKVSGTYIVKTWAIHKDCLWNISKKAEIYNDPLLWPKIWQANTDIIRNPDLIHPGDELTIPKEGPLTDEELKAERKYWRKKARMMSASSEESGN